ncbi:molybdate ABC transporter substrate-binding protein [Denitratisoma oestradiolicum]|nr:molybdate ABC transporter substrate-binding protein [Denitratisoma oestradiolicum]
MKILALPIAWAFITGMARANEVQVAVAANFILPLKAIATRFERATGHHVTLVPGATGKLYAQINNGAPFDILLAADSETPARLEREGMAEPGSRFTYATGRLVLWSSRPDLVDAKGDVLRGNGFDHLALANPRLAPYGMAAQETMQALGVRERLQARLVQAENIAQAYQFVASGNAALGFVAYSQIHQGGKAIPGSHWLVPTRLHSPLRQDAVLLNRGRGNRAAEALLKYLKENQTTGIIRSFGYE